MTEPFWGTVELEEGVIRRRKLGALHLWLQMHESEIWIAYTNDPDQTIPHEKERLPRGVEWARWALKKRTRKLELVPVLPDLPIIVHSEYPLRLTRDSNIQIFTRIPLWVRVTSGSKGEDILVELPTFELSKTWFGTPMEGELCYWSSTKARRQLTHDIYRPNLINCPIWIRNRSEEALDFEKFCYRVERLSIYKYEEEFWADETNIVYQGEEQNSEVRMTGRLPEHIKDARLVNGPRKRIQTSLATRTFRKFLDETLFFTR